MIKKIVTLSILLSALYLSGCASVPLASKEEDNSQKEFKQPSNDKSGIYIYRKANLGMALKKTIKVNGKEICETADSTYFYLTVAPGQHLLQTESEIGYNDAELNTVGGENYYIKQWLRPGLIVGGAHLSIMDKEQAQKDIQSLKLIDLSRCNMANKNVSQ